MALSHPATTNQRPCHNLAWTSDSRAFLGPDTRGCHRTAIVHMYVDKEKRKELRGGGASTEYEHEHEIASKV